MKSNVLRFFVLKLNDVVKYYRAVFFFFCGNIKVGDSQTVVRVPPVVRERSLVVRGERSYFHINIFS